METITVEFLDPDFLKIKDEVLYDEAESPFNSDNYQSRTKCGEIFKTRSKEFLLICSYCHNIYSSMITFGRHVLEKHQDLPGIGETVKEESASAITAAFEDIEQVDCPVSADFNLEDNQPIKNASNNSESNVTLLDNLEPIEDDWKNNFDELTDDIAWEETDELANQDPIKRLLPNTTAFDSEPPVDCSPSDSPKKKKRIREKYISKSIPLRSGAKKVSPDSVKNADLFCEHCSREYANRSYFRRHAMQHENLPAAIKRDPDWLKCISCSTESKTREEWLTHEKAHNDGSQYRKKYISQSNRLRSGAKKVSPKEVHDSDLFCEHCSREYASRSYFRRHAMQHENLPAAIKRDPDWLKCISCSIESKTREEWLTHEKTHNGRRQRRKSYISESNRLRSGAKKVGPSEVHNSDLFCEHCSREYASSSYFRRHAMQHENLPAAIKRDPDWLKCISCTVESKTREEWLAHEKTHNGRRQRKKGWISKTNPFRSNARKVSPDAVQNIDLYCEHCSREYDNKSYFRRHAMQHENLPIAIRRDPDWLKCICCSIVSKTREEWLLHEKTHVGRRPRGHYQCTFCPKMFQTATAVEEHMNIHQGLKPFKCDQCPLGFASLLNLQRHVRRVHLGERSHSCEECDRKFFSMNEKQEHILRAHKKEKPIQCEVCGKKFLSNTTMNMHMKTHLTRDVKCPHCPKMFFHSKQLRLHMAKHSMARPYECHTCGKAFSRRNSLKAHVLLHEEIKKFVCKICDRGFAQRAGLYSHMKTHYVAS